MKLTEFKAEFQNIKKLLCFEIPVINIGRDEETYIVFEVAIKGNSFIATHEGLTNRQNKSKYIQKVSVKIDLDFQLDENLDSLYYACYNKISKSTLFRHTY